MGMSGGKFVKNARKCFHTEYICTNLVFRLFVSIFFLFILFGEKSLFLRKSFPFFSALGKTAEKKKDPMQSKHRVFSSPFLKVFLKREFK